MDNDDIDYKQRLDECEDRYNRIFDLTSAPSKIIDPELTILRVNQGIVDLLGYSKKEIVGTKILDYACEEYNDGHLILDKKLFNITNLINDCCEHIKIGGYEIIINGDKDLLIDGDPDKIDQVLVNFVNNAVKYAPQSKVIHIRLEKLENEARISVIDTGPGIPLNKQQQLFDRYFRVDSSGLQYSGLGLGLYINAEIIKRHGGEIGVDSEMGKGSTFWFTLPLT